MKFKLERKEKWKQDNPAMQIAGVIQAAQGDLSNLQEYHNDFSPLEIEAKIKIIQGFLSEAQQLARHINANGNAWVEESKDFRAINTSGIN